MQNGSELAHRTIDRVTNVASDTISRAGAEDRRDCYWLYVVTNCGAEPRLQEPIKDPARFHWHEPTQVAHDYLSVDALTRPMQVREESPPYEATQCDS